MSIDVSKLKVDSRDYVSIYNDLVSAIPDVSQIWNSTDENDPGIVLVKLMAMYGDMLSYNHDRAVLETYPESVQQRKNAAQIFRLIGYKMRWYRSARCTAYISNTSDYPVTLPEYTRFSTKDNNIYYTYISSDVTKNPIIHSSMSSSGSTFQTELIQGYPRLPSLINGNVIPDSSSSSPWHSVYDYNISKNDVQLGSRIYVTDNAIEETSITLIDDTGEQWIQVDNIDSLTESGKFYELRIDEYDNPYIELVSYWSNLNVSKFKLFYIVSAGEAGQITDNAIYRADSKVIAITSTASSNYYQTDVSQYISVTNKASTYGYNPETPDEARIESAKYVNTYDTLVTLSDFEKAVRRVEGVANCVVTDKTIDPNYSEDYISIGDNRAVQTYSTNLSRNNIIIYKSDIVRFEVHICNKNTGDEGILAYAADDSGTLVAGSEYGGRFESGKVETENNMTIVTVTMNGRLLTNEYLVASYYTTMGNTDVRIYVTKSEDYTDTDDDAFINSIMDNINSKKLMPLDIIVDLNINYYSWTVGGTIYLKEKVSLDRAQDILVNINNALKFKYAKTKMQYNESIGYAELIDTIMNTDNIIRNIDINPIEYSYVFYNAEGLEIVSRPSSKEEITGKSRESGKYTYDLVEDKFIIQLDNMPVKPGSVTIRIIDGKCVITDDKIGGLLSNSSTFMSGKIDYDTGTIEVNLSGIDSSYLDNGEISASINYTRNAINMALFSGVNTNKLIVSDECIKDLYYN